MGHKLSKIRRPRSSLRAEKKKSQGQDSVAATCLDKILPPSEESKPGSWNVFATEEDRQKFIGAVLLVLTENGQIDIRRNRIDLYYSRAAVLQYRVVLAVLIDTGIKHTHVGRQAGTTQKEAFRYFMKEIYQEFETLLVGMARNFRPRQPVAQAPAPKPAATLSHKKTEASLCTTKSSVRPQTERAQTTPARLQFAPATHPNKAPRATVSVAGRQATIPATLAHKLQPRASMMDLLERRYEAYEEPSAQQGSPYRMSPYASQSQPRIRNIRSVPTMRSVPYIVQPQPYIMSGALPAEEGSEYEQPEMMDESPYMRENLLSRQASFVTAPTHYDPGPSQPRLQHSQSYMTLPVNVPAVASSSRPARLHHSQSLVFPTEQQQLQRPTPSRYMSSRVKPMPSIASLGEGPLTPPESPGNKGKLRVETDVYVAPRPLRVVNASIHASSSSGSTIHSREAICP